MLSFFIILWLLVLSIVLYSFIAYKIIIPPYRQKFKTEIFNPIVTAVDKSLTYYPQKNITLEEFRASGLERYFGYADHVHVVGEDYVEGMLGKTAVSYIYRRIWR